MNVELEKMWKGAIISCETIPTSHGRDWKTHQNLNTLASFHDNCWPGKSRKVKKNSITAASTAAVDAYWRLDIF